MIITEDITNIREEEISLPIPTALDIMKVKRLYSSTIFVTSSVIAAGLTGSLVGHATNPGYGIAAALIVLLTFISLLTMVDQTIRAIMLENVTAK